MTDITYATHSFEFDFFFVDNVCSTKAIFFVFIEVRKEKEEMNKVNGQYDIKLLHQAEAK